MFAIFLGSAALFGLSPYLLDVESFIHSADGLPEFSPFVRIAFGTFHHSAFALSFAWVIFAFSRQYGGIQLHNATVLCFKIIFNFFKKVF